MTLQEKIDKLPLSIEYNGKEYFLHIENNLKRISLRYIDPRFDLIHLFSIYDDRILLKTSFRLEELIDRALKIIENKEWEI
jgi:hypothetical protein